MFNPKTDLAVQTYSCTHCYSVSILWCFVVVLSYQGGGGDQITAASKGIIERSHQKDALLYTAYAPNPFENMSEEDILQYKKEIAEKTGQGKSL